MSSAPFTLPPPPSTLHAPLTADLCLKCNICTAACPVAAVTDLFPGPKAVGPQAQRFRHPALPAVDNSVDYCSGCGVCSLVCPHGVLVAEMNTIARAKLAEQRSIPLRNRLISRPEALGRFGSPFAPLSNLPLRLRPLRWLVEKTLKIDRRAPLPPFARRTFRAWFRRTHKERPLVGMYKVLYFHGCSTNFYEPRVGKAAAAVLERNGCKVTLGEQNCCGLPLQSNGDFRAARAYAAANVRKLAPWVREGYVIVGTSTSCTLALKHEYRHVLGLAGEDFDLVAANTYDFFEFMQRLADEGRLDQRLLRRSQPIIYHAPCQLRAHWIGRPAAEILRLIPGVRLIETTADCCGIAGTYGLKNEKYEIARKVGGGLFEEIRADPGARVACDSETCRWWIDAHTGVKSVHPVELLAEAYVAQMKR